MVLPGDRESSYFQKTSEGRDPTKNLSSSPATHSLPRLLTPIPPGDSSRSELGPPPPPAYGSRAAHLCLASRRYLMVAGLGARWPGTASSALPTTSNEMRSSRGAHTEVEARGAAGFGRQLLALE